MWLILSFAVVATFVAAALLQWLWNETMPELFALSVVSYWQAFRLLIIAGILIGGPGLVHLNYGV